ncbi:MAG: hypothetical protein ACI9U2_001882 [Bradymonadia bacterium]|jgi:hypothetical protein
MRRALLLWVALAGCGDAVGPDRATLCVEPAFEMGENARIMAVFHAEDAAQAIEPVVIDDVALIDGRGCLSLRPPPAAWFKAAVEEPRLRPGIHEVRVANPVVRDLSAGPPLRYFGVLIDLAVYTDGDRSGAFEPPDAVGVGPDRLRMRLSTSGRAQLPVWLGEIDAQMKATFPEELSGLLDVLAPGNQPFAVSKPADAPRAWRGADRAELTPWAETFVLPPTAARTRCDIGSAWPRCRSIVDQGAFATARLVDPRVPPEAMSRPITGFDPVVNLPPADAPVSPVVEARQCADVGAYRVARERTIVPRQNDETCICDVWVRTRWVIALADDPPEWLSCVGRPMTPGAGAGLAAEAGLSPGIEPQPGTEP